MWLPYFHGGSKGVRHFRDWMVATGGICEYKALQLGYHKVLNSLRMLSGLRSITAYKGNS